MNNNLYKLNWISLAAILLTVLISSGGISAQAAPKQKKSEKLTKKMAQVSGNDFIDVIIKPTASWTSGLTNELHGKGALLKKSF